MNCRKRRKRGGILPAFLIPAAIAAAKAAATGAISAGAGYVTKKALEAATRKKLNGWAKSVRRNGQPINNRSSKCFVKQIRLRRRLYRCYKRHLSF